MQMAWMSQLVVTIAPAFPAKPSVAFAFGVRDTRERDGPCIVAGIGDVPHCLTVREQNACVSSVYDRVVGRVWGGNGGDCCWNGGPMATGHC